MTTLRLPGLMAAATVLLSALTFSQQAVPTPNWDAWQFLIGEWVGEGGGDPGQGGGGFTFSTDLQDRILVRRNYAAYPATKDRPAFRHDDLMVIYREPGGSTKADYYDNEGHIIRYDIAFANDSNSVVFTSLASDSEPRYRLTYARIQSNSVSITFEIAPPGHPDKFREYIKAAAKKAHD